MKSTVHSHMVPADYNYYSILTCTKQSFSQPSILLTPSGGSLTSQTLVSVVCTNDSGSVGGPIGSVGGSILYNPVLYSLDQMLLSISNHSRIEVAPPDVLNEIVAALKY